MRGRSLQAVAMLSALALAALLVRAAAATEFEFVPATSAHGPAARAYAAIWAEHWERILAALEARTCLPLAKTRVTALIDDAISHSGGHEHPMRLRATYPEAIKQATLVHELAHRHLWQLEERLEDLDGHETLYLILDRVWGDVWGEDFAAERVRDESAWRNRYDYAGAWSFAQSLDPAERAGLWRQLLEMNGFGTECGRAGR